MKREAQDARGAVPSSQKHEDEILSKVPRSLHYVALQPPGFEKPTPHPQPDARPCPGAPRP